MNALCMTATIRSLRTLGAATVLLAACSSEPEPASSSEPMPGMDMNGMGTSGGGSGAEVQLTADQLGDFGVTFGTVEMRTLDDVVRTVGIIAIDETRLTSVTARFDGYVERLLVDFTGRPVQRDEPLAEIYSPELLAAQEDLLLAARVDAEISRSSIPGVDGSAASLVDAARQRLQLLGIDSAEIAAVMTEGRPRRALTLRSPATGVVIEKNVVQGDAIEAGQMLYTIADLSVLWVEAELREADAQLVRVGDPASVQVSAYAGRGSSGRVDYVYPTVDDVARTLTARVVLQNPDDQLRPGMYATVTIRPPGRTALTVPASAIFDTGVRRLAFVDLGSGRLRPQDVEVGRITGELAEVVFGLEPGQRVVTSAQYLLDSESNLAEVMRSMIGQMSTSDMGTTQMPGMPGMEMPATPPNGGR